MVLRAESSSRGSVSRCSRAKSQKKRTVFNTCIALLKNTVSRTGRICWHNRNWQNAVLVCTQTRCTSPQLREHSRQAIMSCWKSPCHPILMNASKWDNVPQSSNASSPSATVLRYTNFSSRHFKQVLADGAIGRLISIQHNENVAYWHYAHSYVRGNWRNSAESSPMILAKSCTTWIFCSG